MHVVKSDALAAWDYLSRRGWRPESGLLDLRSGNRMHPRTPVGLAFHEGGDFLGLVPQVSRPSARVSPSCLCRTSQNPKTPEASV